jgi:hypothetical protein
MITKYTRKDINKNPQLHNEEFVLQCDCEELLQKFVDAAVSAGADMDELMKGVSDDR